MAVEQNGQQPEPQPVNIKPVIIALGSLNWEIIVLQQENAELRQENERLQLQLVQQIAENDGEVRT